MHEGYAVKERVQVEPYQYCFDIDYVYHSESFIKGSKAKIVLHPSLTLHGKQVPLSHLKKTKITVNTVNNL